MYINIFCRYDSVPLSGVAPNSRLNGWPSPDWKAALFAALDPSGTPVDIEPTFDEYYLEPYGIANVTILVDPNYVSKDYASNILPFLYLSGVENVFRWKEVLDVNDFSDSIEFSNALIIPDYRMNFDTRTQELLLSFVDNGGYLVIAGSNLEELYLVSNIKFKAPLEYPPFGVDERFYYYFPDGFDLVSHHVYDSPFESNYQRPYLSSFPTSRSVVRNAIREYDTYTSEYTNEYCPYVFGFTSTNTYCGVWSKSFGNGRISVLSNNFKDTYVNCNSLCINNNSNFHYKLVEKD